MGTVDHQLYQQVSRELQVKEKIEWLDQPEPAGYAASSLKILLFAIPWTTGAVFWIVGAAGFQVPDFRDKADFFPLFGLPFLLIGLGMMLRPVFDYFAAYRVVYVITNRRVLFITFGRKKKVSSFDLSEIGSVTRVEKPDGSGSLYFTVRGPASGKKRKLNRRGFKAISQVKMAESHLQVRAPF